MSKTVRPTIVTRCKETPRDELSVWPSIPGVNETVAIQIDRAGGPILVPGNGTLVLNPNPQTRSLTVELEPDEAVKVAEAILKAVRRTRIR